MTKITIDYDTCDGASCAECADACPMEVFTINGDQISIQNTEQCSVCEICADICPNQAITIQKE